MPKNAIAKIRLFTEQSLKSSIIELTKEQAHYLHNVMRKSPGDEIFIFNDVDGQYLAKIVSINKKSVSVEIKSKKADIKDTPDIMLCFSLVKSGAVKNIIQKATELGVSFFQPIITKYSSTSDLNIERLKAIAIEAAEQSDRLTIPKFGNILKFDDLINGWDQTRNIIFCDESGFGKPINNALKEMKPGKYAIIIGPEGGFAKEELEKMKNCQYIWPVCMGPRILRADTAAIAALSCFMSILGDWSESPKFQNQ